jgi:hypothetical protein
MLSNSHFFPRKLSVRIRQKLGEKMATNYFERLVKYTKNVYKIECGFNKMKDGRVNPTHDTSTMQGKGEVYSKLGKQTYNQ